MQILHIFDNKDYNPLWKSYNREAVRAIIIQNRKIALVRSKNEGFYKFPGGGIELNETHIDALIRETREETGLHIIPESVKELGMLWEKRRGLYANEIFSQKSYYYYSKIYNKRTMQELDEYEIELGYEFVWADIKNAYHINTELGKNDRFSFLIREAYVLNLLMLSVEHTT